LYIGTTMLTGKSFCFISFTTGIAAHSLPHQCAPRKPAT
jgi:hypothetical protein